MLKDKQGTRKGVKWWVVYSKESVIIFTQKTNEQFRQVYQCKYPIVDRKYDKRDLDGMKELLDKEIELTGKGK